MLPAPSHPPWGLATFPAGRESGVLLASERDGRRLGCWAAGLLMPSFSLQIPPPFREPKQQQIPPACHLRSHLVPVSFAVKEFCRAAILVLAQGGAGSPWRRVAHSLSVGVCGVSVCSP